MKVPDPALGTVTEELCPRCKRPLREVQLPTDRALLICPDRVHCRYTDRDADED